jgi:hypothetical protein
MKHIITRLLVLCLIITSCELDLDYQLKIDNRLDGKDGITIVHPNPNTGQAYTQAELDALDYDPAEEDFFINDVNLTIVVQAKPLKIEVTNTTTSTVIASLENSTQNSDGNYEVQYSTTVSDLGVGIGDNLNLKFKIIYDNLGEDGFDYNAELFYEFLVRDNSPNLALNKPASASSEFFGTTADLAVDGNTNSDYPNIIHTRDEDGEDAWFEVDLEGVYNIRQINVWNRTDCCSERLTNFHVFISETPFTASDVSGIQGQSGVIDIHETGQAGHPSKFTDINVMGRYVRLQFDSTSGRRTLTIGELEVY